VTARKTTRKTEKPADPKAERAHTEDAATVADDPPAAQPRPRRRRTPRGDTAPAAVTADGGPPEAAGSAPEPGASVGVPAGGAGAPEEAAAVTKRRSRRGGRGRKPAAAGTPSPGDEVAAGRAGGDDAPGGAGRGRAPGDGDEGAAGAAADGGAAGAAPDESDGGPKRRRRGARGGRRVRAREARRAAALASGGEGEVSASGAPSRSPEPVRDAQPAPVTGREEADASQPPAARRRGRRGGRRKGAEGETVAPGGGAARAAAVEPADEAAQPAPGSPVSEVASPPEAVTGRDVTPAGEAEGKKRGRRGGRRGKRGAAAAGAELPEGTPADTVGASPAEVAAAPGDATGPGADEKETKKARRRDRRRPKAIVRSENLTGADANAIEGPALTTGRRPEVSVDLPKRKLILVTEDPSELRVALVEDGRLAEIYFERPEKRSYLGDIYRGKVENVLAGIDAAFVDFGLDKNGFLYVDEVRTGEGDRRGRRIGEVLKQGQDVVVQVMKDPMGSKGARLTMHISLAGRYVVYVPGGSGVGVSRRLGQGERERLRELCKELRVKNAGLIVRTAAEGEGLEEIRRDVRFLSRLWSRLKKKAETAPIPGVIHKEVDIALEVTRDLFNESVESLIVDDEKRLKTIVAFLEKVAPELVARVRLHTGAEPLFEAYGIEQQISRALERRVPLPSGGNIVIDHAEALTVIDVNSGRYTSGRGLEDTILRTNLEAAREVVRQLRLRDIGGIIIIDFIDMARVKNRETVLATLEAELDTDRTKTYVVELSPLGLVEMTRQNTTDGARGILTRTCPACQGKARTQSEETVALAVERRLRLQSKRSGAKACLVELNAGVAERLTSGGRLKALEKETGRRIFLEGSSAVAVDAFRILAEGSPAQVQGQRVPVREGQEVEVELEFALTYSPREAVGYVDGYMVIVEGGRSFLGQKRKVRIGAASRTGASAVLTGGKRAGG
jgi:ribonuclease G